MRPLSLLSALVLSATLTGCMMSGRTMEPPMAGPMGMNPMTVTTPTPTPSWAPDIDPQMWAVVDQLSAFGNVPYGELTGFQARMEKTPTNAVMALLTKAGMPPMSPAVTIAHRRLTVGPPEGVLVRTYTPTSGSGPRPVIVYYHGGGWVIADLDTYEPSAIALAEQTGAIVVSVGYRQAPEHRYPAAHDDSFAAYQWVTQNAAQLGGDPMRIATVGESAGGNLAVAVALRAQAQSVRMPVAIVSVYPIADGDVQSASYDRYANAAPLNRAGMEWFFDNYAPDWRTTDNAEIDLTSRDYAGFPPTTVINAQIDPLQAEGEALAAKMRADGVDVQQQTYMGVTHEFFGMAAVLEQAVEAQRLAATRLRAAFGM